MERCTKHNSRWCTDCLESAPDNLATIIREGQPAVGPSGQPLGTFRNVRIEEGQLRGEIALNARGRAVASLCAAEDADYPPLRMPTRNDAVLNLEKRQAASAITRAQIAEALRAGMSGGPAPSFAQEVPVGILRSACCERGEHGLLCPVLADGSKASSGWVICQGEPSPSDVAGIQFCPFCGANLYETPAESA